LERRFKPSGMCQESTSRCFEKSYCVHLQDPTVEEEEE
jgi:hypothetical protein